MYGSDKIIAVCTGEACDEGERLSFGDVGTDCDDGIVAEIDGHLSARSLCSLIKTFENFGIYGVFIFTQGKDRNYLQLCSPFIG